MIIFPSFVLSFAIIYLWSLIRIHFWTYLEKMFKKYIFGDKNNELEIVVLIPKENCFKFGISSFSSKSIKASKEASESFFSQSLILHYIYVVLLSKKKEKSPK